MAEAYLSTQRYSPITAGNYTRVWRQVMDYAISKKATHITDKILNAFVNDRYGISE